MNVVLDDNKRRRRAATRLQRVCVELADPAIARSDGGDPFRAYCDGLAALALAEAVAALPAAFREVFSMREVEDLSCEAIANRTGISGGTVRSRIARARARLRNALAPELAGAAA